MVKRKIDILIAARDQASRQFGNVSRETERFANNLARTSSASIGTEAVMAGLAAGATAAAIAWKGLVASFNQAADFEQLSVSFEVLIGDLDKATLLMNQMTEFSIRTPFEPDEVLRTSKQLASFGFETSRINGLIETLGELSAGSGKELSQLGRIVGKVYTKGRAQAEELNQFAEAGIPIIQELAKMYNVTEAQILKAASAGKIGFGDIERAMVSLTTEGGKFAGMMERQSKTARGLQSTLTGLFKESGKGIGKFLLPAFKDFQTGLIGIMGDINEIIRGLSIMGGFQPQIIGGNAVEQQKKLNTEAETTRTNFALTKDELNAWVLEIQAAEKLAKRLGIDQLEASMILRQSKEDQQIIVTRLEKEKALRDEIARKQEAFQRSAKAAHDAARLSAANTITGLTREIELQRLINAGKEKQAAVQAAVNAAQDRFFTGEEIDKVAKLRAELFDLQREQGKTTPQADSAANVISGTVARFLSFRQQGTGADRTAQENKDNNKKTADNTADMKSILTDISTKLDTQNTVPIAAAGFTR